MLVRVKYKTEQKYMKITDLTLKHFLELDALSPEVSPDESLDSSGNLSCCDSDDTVILPSNKRQREECEAERLIENILLKKPGGDRVIKEYTRTKTLTDTTRRQMVNMLTAEMTHGSKAYSLVHDPQKCSDMLSVFPRFKDVKGLIEQDFVLLFGESTSAKFLEKWPTTFKDKVIQQSKGHSHSHEVQELIEATELTVEENQDEMDLLGWDSDLSSLMLLLHLLPPSAQGRKKTGRMSATQAMGYLVVFRKAGTSIQEHLDSIEERRQPYILAVGTSRSRIHAFYIVVDKVAIPCKAAGSLCAFDELFKAHFVFGTAYCESLRNMYTFIQTTIYKIDIGKVKESPRVAELRARFLQ